MKIALNLNKGFKWYKNNTTYIKGYFYIDEVFYEKDNGLNYLNRINDKSSFVNLLKRINGVFTIIFYIENTTFIITDLTRSFPIFYTNQNDSLYISDDILFLKNNFNFNNFDTSSEIELNASYHTYGKKTLLKNVYQVQASECLVIQNNKIIDRFFNYSYAIKKESNIPYTALKKKAVHTFENSFKKFITSLNNRPVAIPLSGGYDSRLIAVFLKKFDYKNVVCYTYGRKDSFEIENSKKVATKLGFKWLFIEYSSDLIANFLNTTEFKNYAHFAGKLSSTPNVQEYFAVKYLKKIKQIPGDTIFIPGYAGDLLGGSQYIKVIPDKLSHQSISKLIIDRKFKYSSPDTKKNIYYIEEILSSFHHKYSDYIPATIFEDFDIKEKISKYIFNSVSFYTYFGFEFRVPFWDKELLDFFKEIPIKHKKMKVFFDDVLVNEYFKPFDVFFEKELQPSSKKIQIQKLKDKVKPIFPNFIKQFFLYKNDWNNYKPITNMMIYQMKSNNIKVSTSVKSYNEIITQWYIAFSKNRLK